MTPSRTTTAVSRRTALAGLGAGGLGLALAVRGQAVTAQEATPATDGSAVVVRRLYEEVFNQKNLDMLDEIDATDFVDHSPGAPQGRTGAKQTIGGLLAAFPDLQVTVEQWIVDGDMVATFVTFRGTHQGELLGVAPTGKPVEWSHIDIHRVEGGQIAELWHTGVFELIQLQLGYQLVPPAGPSEAATPAP